MKKDLLIQKIIALSTIPTELAQFLINNNEEDNDKVLNILLNQDFRINDIDDFSRGLDYSSIFFLIKRKPDSFDELELVQFLSSLNYVPDEVLGEVFNLSKEFTTAGPNRPGPLLREWMSLIRKHSKDKDMNFILKQIDILMGGELTHEEFRGIMRPYFCPRFEFIKKTLDKYRFYHNNVYCKKFNLVIEKLSLLESSFKLEIKGVPLQWNLKELGDIIDYDEENNHRYFKENLIIFKFNYKELKMIMKSERYRNYFRDNVDKISLDKYDYTSIDYLIKKYPEKYGDILLANYIPNKFYIISKRDGHDLKKMDLVDLLRYRSIRDMRFIKEIYKLYKYEFIRDCNSNGFINYNIERVTLREPLSFIDIEDISRNLFSCKGKRLKDLWLKHGFVRYDFTRMYRTKEMSKRVLNKMKKEFKQKKLKYSLLTLIVLFGERKIDYNHCCYFLENKIAPELLVRILNISYKLNNKQLIKFLNMALKYSNYLKKKNLKFNMRDYLARDFLDSIKMIKKLSYCPISLDFKNIEQAHQDVIILYNNDKVAAGNYELNQDISIPEEIEGYKVVIPQTKGDLRIVGGFLHNCVGSYSRRVRNKRCNIVVLYKENKPNICLEIVNKKIVQATFNYNKRLDNDLVKKIEDELFNDKLLNLA